MTLQRAIALAGSIPDHSIPDVQWAHKRLDFQVRRCQALGVPVPDDLRMAFWATATYLEALGEAA